MDLLVFGKKYLPQSVRLGEPPQGQGGAVSLPGSSLMSPLGGSQALIAKGTKDKVKQAKRAISYKLRPVGSPRLVYSFNKSLGFYFHLVLCAPIYICDIWDYI